MNRKGFTLIELLLVITLIGVLFSVTLPVSYSMYQRYQAGMKAEKILTFVSTLRVESFLYGQERTISASEGRMYVDGVEQVGLGGLFIQVDIPIKFFRTGTTSGGEIKVYAEGTSFVLSVQPPLGELVLRPA